MHAPIKLVARVCAAREQWDLIRGIGVDFSVSTPALTLAMTQHASHTTIRITRCTPEPVADKSPVDLVETEGNTCEVLPPSTNVVNHSCEEYCIVK